MFARSSFTAPQIRELAHDPQRFLRDLERDDDDSGFGYPQEAWRYGAIDAFHRADRSVAAAAAFLDAALKGGSGPSPWKVEKLAEISREIKSYALRDQRRPSRYVETLYRRRPPPATWRGHQLALPAGLRFEAEGTVLRLVWTAKDLAFVRRGTTMVVAATLAQVEAGLGLSPRLIEVYHLRDGDERRFEARDLKAMWSGLDRLLGLAEGRPEEPSAA